MLNNSLIKISKEKALIKKIGIVALIFVFWASFFVILKPNNCLIAEENLKIIVVEGSVEESLPADYAVLRFNIRTNSMEFDDGQNKLNQIYENIKSKVMDLNEENLVYITHTSCYPVFKDSLKAFEFSCSFAIKTKNVQNTNEIIQLVGKEQEVSYYGTDYSILNQQEHYALALSKAKEDAIAKAKALNPNVNLVAILNTNVSNYSNYEQSGTIVIYASIRAVFAPEQEAKTDTEKVNKSSFC